MSYQYFTTQGLIINGSVPHPTQPPGGGWELVSSAATADTIVWTWRRVTTQENANQTRKPLHD